MLFLATATAAAFAVFTSANSAIATFAAVCRATSAGFLHGFALATIAALAIFAGAGSGSATLATFAVIFAATGVLRCARIRLCVSGTRIASLTLCFVAPHGTHIRATGQRNGQRKKCQNGNAENDITDLRHDKFPFDK